MICVPMPLSTSRDPDLFFVEESTKTVASVLRRGQLVVLKSTTWPGTTREVMIPILERSGLKAGVDFFLVYSPEREDPGNPDYSAPGIPKLVGGIDTDSCEVAKALYEQAKSVKNSKICVLGAAYKKDVDGERESPSFELIDRLMQKGSIVTFSDPHIPVIKRKRK